MPSAIQVIAAVCVKCIAKLSGIRFTLILLEAQLPADLLISQCTKNGVPHWPSAPSVIMDILGLNSTCRLADQLTLNCYRFPTVVAHVRLLYVLLSLNESLSVLPIQ